MKEKYFTTEKCGNVPAFSYVKVIDMDPGTGETIIKYKGRKTKVYWHMLKEENNLKRHLKDYKEGVKYLENILKKLKK